MSASEVFTPERLAWCMTALALVGDARGFPEARVGDALTRARDEAGLAGTTRRALVNRCARPSRAGTALWRDVALADLRRSTRPPSSTRR